MNIFGKRWVRSAWVTILPVCAGMLLGCAAITVPGQVVDNDIPANRTGYACGATVLGFIIGDTSVGAAMAHGRLATVSRIEYELYGVPPLLSQYCTVVRGASR